jgi:CMP-N,N'-diacetyllegionaminic acid synthase
LRIAAVILARGGSKGIPRKNLIDFCGRPLIYWTVKRCLDSELISDVWVSSDSDEILTLSKDLGSNVIRRPLELSNDSASSESAWVHAVEHIKKVGYEQIDYILAPQVTSPLRDAGDFDRAINLIISNGYDSLISVTRVHDYFMWRFDSNATPRPLNYDYKARRRRQEIEPTFLENGSFYIFRPSVLTEESNRIGGRVGMYVMEHYKMFQIDSPDDIELSSIIMKGYGLDNC